MFVLWPQVPGEAQPDGSAALMARTAWGNGSTTAWRKLRAAVLARDGYRCQLNLPGCTTKATHVHHTLGRKYGDDPVHLVSSCAWCNLSTGEPGSHDPAPRPRTAW